MYNLCSKFWLFSKSSLGTFCKNATTLSSCLQRKFKISRNPFSANKINYFSSLRLVFYYILYALHLLVENSFFKMYVCINIFFILPWNFQFFCVGFLILSWNYGSRLSKSVLCNYSVLHGLLCYVIILGTRVCTEIPQ
jgi:hypothetical protein